jgi:cardiolipin synthase
MRRHEAATTVAWLLTLLVLPVIGALLYLTFGIRPVDRSRRRKWLSNEQIRRFVQEYQAKWSTARLDGSLQEIHADQRAVMRLVTRLGLFPATVGNDVTYHVDARETYALMERAIEQAEHHINLDYYIFRPDATGKRFADLLIAKAKKGVKVNLLYDTLGSWSLHRNRDFLARLTDAGVRVRAFLPPKLLMRPWHLNLRNHRKILVVDGKVGFTGGLNIGQAFVTPPRRFGVWRDAHLRIEGPAVLELQWVFAEDWHFATGEQLLSAEYFPEPKRRGEHVVQILPSGPDEEIESAHTAFFTAITTAAEEVLLCTPYFIPDTAILMALQSAALRGVDVRLLVPRRSDHRIVTLAGRSYYEDLLTCGVKIYEFLAGVEHSKVLIVDRRFTIVGSANMDMRSFSYNFEVSAQVYGADFAECVRKVFLNDLAESEIVDPQVFRRRNLLVRFAENSCRLLSPLL